MPRPRTVADEDIVAATGRVIGRVGPAKLTLALVAQEVGLSPATLVQRFGSKRGLLLALGKSGGGDHAADVENLLAKHRTPLAALRAYLLCFANMAGTPDELANHLAAFQMDLVDPELREIALRITADNETTVRKLVRAAVEAGELDESVPKELASILLAVAHGSLLSWAVRRKGTARRSVARHVDVVLAPYVN